MKDRTALFSGLALFFCFALLTGSGHIINAMGSVHVLFGIFIAEIAGFLLPILLVWFGSDKNPPVTLRTFPKVSTPTVLGFTVFSGIAVSFGGFLVNYILLRANVNYSATLSNFTFQASGKTSVFWLFLAFIVVPPVFEELFLRGALFSAHEKLAGTGLCIFFSGLCFAMLHGSLSNFLGPLLAGCLYAYLTYAFDCVWLAVIAHLFNNAFYLGIMWLSNTYGAFGIWNYIPGLAVLFFLFFGYLSFCCLEHLLVHGKVFKLRRTQRLGAGLAAIALNPGFAVFVIAFLAKAVLGLI